MPQKVPTSHAQEVRGGGAGAVVAGAVVMRMKNAELRMKNGKQTALLGHFLAGHLSFCILHSEFLLFASGLETRRWFTV
jgi:hypothetical protein